LRRTAHGIRQRIIASLVGGVLIAAFIPEPAAAAVIDATCTGCGGLPPWSYAVLAVIGLLLAMVILWLLQRLARDVRSARFGRVIVVGG
jgi:hypothetical protein